jgi:para-nitrobenzyl esterase
VPFAEPPLGSHRWSPPVPKLPWQGVLDATAFGPGCPQPDNGFWPPVSNTSEDCLSMAIYAPPEQDRVALDPVLVYFHGGSFSNGGAEDPRTNASRLVASYGGRVVVAVVQYRLGVVGFLGGDALRGRGGDASTGNYGLQDQREGLRFLRQHAAAFGGDPATITIAGQSAGAGLVSVHAVSSR